MDGFVGVGDPVVPAGAQPIKTEPRTWVWVQTGPDGEQVLKLYRRRGTLTPLGGRLGWFRAEREYLALERLVAAGVPCTHPLHWSRGRSESHGRWELLATRRIAGARSMRELVEAGERDPAALDLAGLFDTVEAMHRAGVFHGALWSSNVLVASVDGMDRYCIGDMARAVLFPGAVQGALRRADRLDLGHSLTTLGIPAARLPFDDGLRRQLATYRPGKWPRQRARALALLRARL